MDLKATLTEIYRQGEDRVIEVHLRSGKSYCGFINSVGYDSFDLHLEKGAKMSLTTRIDHHRIPLLVTVAIDALESIVEDN